MERMEHMLLCKSTAGRPNGFRSVSLSTCAATEVWMISSTTWGSRSDVIYTKGEGHQPGVVHPPPPPPTDHFTEPGQVNPFIVMKWRGIMYCECEMLKPVLAFLWGRSSLGDTENRALERHRNIHQNMTLTWHNTNTQHKTWGDLYVCLCLRMNFPYFCCSSVHMLLCDFWPVLRSWLFMLQNQF